MKLNFKVSICIIFCLFKLCYSSNDLRFLFFGDWGLAGTNQSLVANQMGTWAKQNNASFLIALGDNFYEDGISSEFDPLWETSYRNNYGEDLNIPWYTILGNHDYHQNPEAEIAYSRNKRDSRWNMPDHEYTVIYQIPNTAGATLQVVFIDTCIIAPDETGQTRVGGIHAVSPAKVEKHLAKIEFIISESKATWLIVAGHYPVYSMGEHGDTPQLINRIVPLLHKYGVQAYLNGHDHTLQHISWRGVEYFTSGHGTYVASTNDVNGWWGNEPSAAAQGVRFGSLSVGYNSAIVTEDTLDIEFYNQYGAILHSVRLTNPRHHFNSIIKEEESSGGGIIIIIIFIIGSLFGVFISNSRVKKSIIKCFRPSPNRSLLTESPSIELSPMRLSNNQSNDVVVHYSRMHTTEDGNEQLNNAIKNKQNNIDRI